MGYNELLSEYTMSSILLYLLIALYFDATLLKKTGFSPV